MKKRSQLRDIRSHPKAASLPVLSVVSPVHCEEEGLAVFLDCLEENLIPLRLSYEILLVDDGSRDNTWARIIEESVRRPRLRALRLSRNFGKEAALVAGVDAAQGKAVITLDSDLQHPPTLIPQMVSLWRQGKAEVVEAQKIRRQRESLLSGWLARLFYLLFACLVPFDLKKASDFKLMDRIVVDAWAQLGERRVFFRGMSSWLGFRRLCLPFAPPDRERGVSQWSFAARVLLALDSLSAYTARPLGVIWIFGLLFAVFALLVGGEALWTHFAGRSVTGFTTVILLILITGTAVLWSVCLMSLYIRQIFHEVKARPRYLISEVAGTRRPRRPPRVPANAPQRNHPYAQATRRPGQRRSLGTPDGGYAPRR
jgi:glycosyltransferase involved in cell wall biosynthesis